MRYASWIFSLFLHLTVLFGGILLSTLDGRTISLNAPVYQVDIVELTPPGPGVKPDAAPGFEEPQTDTQPSPDGAAPIPEDKTPPKPDASAEEAVKKAAEEAARQAALEMQRQADAQAAQQKALAAQKAAEQKAAEEEAIRIAAENAAREKAAKEAAQQKALAEKAAQEKAAQEAADKAAKEKAARDAALKEAAAKNSVSDALKDIKAKSGGSSSANSVKNALADISRQQGGGGGSKTGGSGVSLSAYGSWVEKTIKQNWRFARTGSQTFNTKVELQLGPGGAIQSARIIQSSGDATFDNSAMRAIADTKDSGLLLPPPSATLTRLELNFNSQEKQQ